MHESRPPTAKAYLAAIVESSDDAILSKNTEGIIQTCNAAAERIFGYRAEELIGRPVRILIPPERCAEEEDILRRIRDGERVPPFETVRVRKDGRRIDVSLSVSPLRNPAGEIVGASKIARDITAQKKAREAEAYLAAIIESSTDAIVAMRLTGTIASCNESCGRIYGYEPDELVGKAIHVLIPAELHAEENEILARVGAGERIGHFETQRVTKDGRRIDVSLSISPIRAASGEIVGIAKVARDITEQKRLARELAEQQERHRVTLASIGDGVIATDAAGRVAFMNSVAEDLTGWRLSIARGRPCSDVFRIINEDSRLPVESPVTRVLAEGVVVGLANHTLLISLDGTERPIDDSGAPIRGRDGRIVGVVLVFRDVGERRRAEQERRNVAIERERLLEAERAARADAERASRVKDEFVAMVSHELRTPLNAILGWTQLMQQSPADAEIRRRGLEVIARNTRVQARLISDLLDVSRIVSGKLRLSIEKLDFAALVENVIETVQQAAEAKQVSIHRDLVRGIAIAGDPSRLQQVVWNLLWNAIKFTPERGDVYVVLRETAAGAELTVADTGVGIRSDFLPHIFDRFQQGNLSITRQFGGLGLGLAIAKHLVELHGGSIRAASEGEGRGATFTVLLPAGAPASAAADGADDRSESPAAAHDALDGVRVLIVEDEADTREFLRQFLAAHGASVVAAASAAEALELAAATHPNVLVSDIGLPKVDGYELLARLRAQGSNGVGGIPAIAITAYARPEDRQFAFRAGYQAHLPKPVEPAQLLDAMTRLVRTGTRG
jgi:PAS domain S-box-containing protein